MNKNIFFLSFLLPIGTHTMQSSLDPETKQAILTLIKKQDEPELRQLISSKNIRWVDKEVVQAARQEHEEDKKKPGRLVFSNACNIFLMVAELEPEEAKRLFLNQPCFYLAKHDEPTTSMSEDDEEDQ